MIKEDVFPDTYYDTSRQYLQNF